MSCFEAKKKVVKAKIVENTEIAKDIYKIVLRAKEVTNGAKAGQFVNVYLNNKSLLLPRPISICELEGDNITLVYGVVGQGTKELSSYTEGEEIKLSSANGNGFNLEDMDCVLSDNKDKVVLLVAGGIGVPPMLELAKTIRKKEDDEYKRNRIRLIAVIGFREEPFLQRELQNYCDKVYIATDNGSVGFHGNVVKLIEKEDIQIDYCYSCGPKVMLKALTNYCIEEKIQNKQKVIPLQVSMEERMGCGYGACVGCICKIKEKDIENNCEKIVLKKVCKDGPVFFGNEVVFDE
ncbi:dihydroorotate dehydrogenase electron transfer subunit [Anaerovorax odorimutans]|uniref:dihydroorotate dehydrogenase electron transfer subunit n=1 Tax=Anaerovorax odorimutans TaxID=109327 RepID=UPI0003FB01D9|nr:dihydroorotate dehydrogenase electron transfer subunit [Anaerovorax odorimutans]